MIKVCNTKDAWTSGGGRPPTISFKEMCEKYKYKQPEMRRLLGREDAPKAQLTTKARAAGGGNNTYYDSVAIAAWMRKIREAAP